MKLRRIFAGLAAAAVACAATAITASAALLTRKGNDDETTKVYKVSTEGLDLSKLDKIIADMTVDTGKVSGCIGYAPVGGDWEQVKQELKDTTGQWVASGLEGKVAGGVEIQFWWVNPFYDADGNEGDPGTATIERVQLLDAQGNELTAAAPTEATEPAAEGTEPAETDVTQPAAQETAAPTVTVTQDVEVTAVTNAETAAAGTTLTGVSGSNVSAIFTAAPAAPAKTTAAASNSGKKDSTTAGDVKTGDVGVGVAAAALMLAAATAVAARKKH